MKNYGIACCGVIFLAASAATAQVARFENFTEGSQGTVFVDPISGIQFTNPSTAISSTVFVTEFHSPASPLRPNSSPGTILGANGYAPGPGLSLPYRFGFTATPSAPVDRLAFDVITSRDNFSLPGSFNVSLFNSAGGLISNTPFTITASSFVETHITLPVRPTKDIARFSINNIQNLFISYDNIAIPEPGTLLSLSAASLLIRRRRERSL